LTSHGFIKQRLINGEKISFLQDFVWQKFVEHSSKIESKIRRRRRISTELTDILTDPIGMIE